MRHGMAFCTAVLTLSAAASVALADCPYDHLLIGQDEGTLFFDTALLYRHWNVDWGTNPDPYGQSYYEFTEMYGGGYIRVEPGTSENTDPTHALQGTPAVDYNILLERVFATPGLEFFNDLMQPILTADGETFALSGYPNHHVHMRYYLSDGLNPTLPYAVYYRLTDTTGTYGDSAVYTFSLGAESANGDFDDDHTLTVDDINELLTHWGNVAYDLTGDGLTDQDDVDAWLTFAGSSYGDLDLDGEVAFVEAATAVANIGLTGAGWQDGEFNGNGQVDLIEAGEAVASYKDEAAGAAFGAAVPVSVPEPASAALLAMGATFMLRRRPRATVAPAMP